MAKIIGRISKKQREFLELVEMANRPVEIDISSDPVSIPYYIRYDFYWDWNFRCEADAWRWIRNLEDRGFITVKKRAFASITEAGRAAIENDRIKEPQK